MPWQPLPKMQPQLEVNQVRSQRKICSGSAGSTNSTHSRAKSRPFSGTGMRSAADAPPCDGIVGCAGSVSAILRADGADGEDREDREDGEDGERGDGLRGMRKE